jgi:hypothetical protein
LRATEFLETSTILLFQYGQSVVDVRESRDAKRRSASAESNRIVRKRCYVGNCWRRLGYLDGYDANMGEQSGPV